MIAKIKTLILCIGFLAVADREVWANGESFSIGIDNRYNGESYSGPDEYGLEGSKVAGAYWNNTDGASINDLRLSSGLKVKGARFNVLNKGGDWYHYAPAQLGGGIRDYADGPWEISLTGIPFSKYKIVIFMASDISDKKWGPIEIISGGNTTYYTYTDEKKLTTTDEEDLVAWGSTALSEGYVAEEGVNIMVIPELTGDITLLTHGTSGDDATRGSFYAIQVVNTGDDFNYSLFEAATSYWSFENGISDLKGAVSSWGYDYSNPVFVDSLRKNGDSFCKAVKISNDFHPGQAYTWQNEFTVVAYVDLSKCPNDGAIVSFGNTTTLRKLDEKTVRFGGPNVYVDAENEALALGFHLIVVRKNASGLYIKVDNGAWQSINNVSTINNGLQFGVKWAGGNNAWNEHGALVVDDILIWNGMFLSDSKIDELVAAYPAKHPSEMEINITSDCTYSDLNIPSGVDVLTFVFSDGVTFTMDQAPKIARVKIVCEGLATLLLSDSEQNPFGSVGELLLDGSGGIKIVSLTFPDNILSGNGKLVLDPGEGNVYTMSGEQVSYQGEVEVVSGTVKMGSAKCFGNFGRDAAVRVKSGAVLDINGQTNGGISGENNKLILEKGAGYVNTGAIGDPKFYPFYDLTLEGDVTIAVTDVASGLTRHFNSETYVRTGGYTLTKSGANTFYMSAVTISGGGVVDIVEGTLSMPRAYYTGQDPSFVDGKIIVRSGARLDLPEYNGGASFSVNEFEVQGDGDVGFGGADSKINVASSLTIKKEGEVSLSDRYVMGEDAALNVVADAPVTLEMNTLRMDGMITLPEGSSMGIVLIPNEAEVRFKVSGIESVDHVNVYVDGDEVQGVVKKLEDVILTVSLAKYSVSEDENSVDWEDLPKHERIVISTNHDIVVNIPGDVISSDSMALSEVVVEGEGSVYFKIDATGVENGVDVAPAWLNFIRASGCDFIFEGTDSNGAKLLWGANVNAAISSHLIFASGTHTMSYGYSSSNGASNFGEGATPDRPTLYVKNGAVLNLEGKDLSYWSGNANANGIIRVEDGGRLNLKPIESNTCYFRQQFYLEPGAVLDAGMLGNNLFRLQGGATNVVDSAPVIYVPASEAGDGKPATVIATNGLFLASDATCGIKFEVGAGSKLLIEGDIRAAGADDSYVVCKRGEGNFEVTGSVAPNVIVDGGASVFGASVHGKVTNSSGLHVKGDAVISSADRSLKGGIVVDKGASLVLTNTQDAVNYDGQTELHVYGVFDGVDQRQTFGGNNAVYLHDGACLRGAGGYYGDGQYYAVFDVYRSNTFNVDGGVFFEAGIGVRVKQTLGFSSENGAVVYLNDSIRGAGNVSLKNVVLLLDSSASGDKVATVSDECWGAQYRLNESVQAEYSDGKIVLNVSEVSDEILLGTAEVASNIGLEGVKPLLEKVVLKAADGSVLQRYLIKATSRNIKAVKPAFVIRIR